MAQHLDARSSVEVVHVLRGLLTHAGTQEDVRKDFPHVVKCVNVERSDAKRMVYTYLARHAETCPEETLLAVNAFQKEMAGRDPHLRALALKVMSSVRLPVLLPLQVDAIRRCAADGDRRVRQCAAMAVHKVHVLDQMAMQDGMDVLERLLTDEDDGVVATAVTVLQKVAPDQWQVLHPHYRNLCARMANWDTWGQVYGMNLLHGYARRYLMPPEVEHRADAGTSNASVQEKWDDLNLLLKVCTTLLLSQSTAVVLAATEVLLDAGNEEHKVQVAEALVLSFITSTDEAKFVLLQNILAICKVQPQTFQSHTSRFYTKEYENLDLFEAKLDILQLLANEENAVGILVSFLPHLEGSYREQRKRLIFGAIGKIACKVPKTAPFCMGELHQRVFDSEDSVSADALDSIGMIYKNNMNEHVQTILSLAGKYHALPTSQAQARLLSLLVADLESPAHESDMWRKEFSDLHAFALEILRQVACNFLHEHEDVILQALTVSAKLTTVSAEARHLFSALLSLSEIDASIGIRDRARFLSSVVLADAVELLCKHPKEPELSGTRDYRFRLSTVSLLVGHSAPGYTDLPQFLDDGQGPVNREETIDTGHSKESYLGDGVKILKDAQKSTINDGGCKVAQVDIDSFYDDIDDDAKAE